MPEREYEKLREAYVVAARLADLGDHRAAFNYLATKTSLFLGKWTEEEARRDDWADREMWQASRDAFFEQPSYQ